MKYLISLLTVAALLCACTTTTQPQSLERKAEAVAYITTVKVLQPNQRPEWRPHFVLAKQELEILAEKETLQVLDVVEIIHRLPVDKLKSDDAALYITGGLIFFEDEIGAIAIDNPAAARAVARGLAKGIARGL